MAENFKIKVIELIQKYNRLCNNDNPTQLHIPLKEEYELLKLDSSVVGPDIAGKMFKDGARAIDQFLGLKIVWNAEQLGVS